jgi:SAM-dependent methyltransferase
VTGRGHGSQSGADRAFRAVKGVGRRRLSFLQPVWMRLKRTVFRLRFRSAESRFSEIFRGNHWRNPESASGFGSSLEATVDARRAVTEIVERYAVTSLLDVPCGDFNWMSQVDFKGSYCGGDIVRDLIAENQARYGDERRRFVVLDVTRDPLPASDLVLCRDCLNHLSIGEAARALGNIVESGSSYAALTHYPETPLNGAQETGFIYRPLNLELPPFNWPPPLEIWEEPSQPGKTLALWRLDRVGGR